MSDLALFQIEKSTEIIRNTILTNIIKMFTERNLLKRENLNRNIEQIISTQSTDMIYTVALDNYNDEKNKTYAIKIVFQNVTAINKSFGINEFLASHKNNPKLVVVKDISKKALQYILSNYNNTEIFLEKELMINLVEHILVPKHELLTEEEAVVFYEKYNCKKRNMPKLLSTDPVAKYYNMSPGNICRIIRPSEKSGYVASYRLVVKGSLNNNK